MMLLSVFMMIYRVYNQLAPMPDHGGKLTAVTSGEELEAELSGAEKKGEVSSSFEVSQVVHWARQSAVLQLRCSERHGSSFADIISRLAEPGTYCRVFNPLGRLN